MISPIRKSSQKKANSIFIKLLLAKDKIAYTVANNSQLASFALVELIRERGRDREIHSFKSDFVSQVVAGFTSRFLKVY